MDDELRLVRRVQLDDALAWLAEDRRREPGWILPDLTRVVGRLHPGTVTIVSGRPGAGKTTFLGQQVDQWAAEGRKVCVIPMETTQMIWRAQWACRALGYGWEHVLEQEWDMLPAGAEAKVKAHLQWQVESETGQRVWIVDQDRLTGNEFLAWITDAAAEGYEIILLDYVQELDVGSADKYRALEELVRQIRSTTLACGIRTVLASQLARPNDKDAVAEYQPASLGSLSGTAALEQSATTVLMLHRGLKIDLVEGDLVSVRRGLKAVDTLVDPGCMVVNVLKNRNKGNVGAQVRAWVHQGRIYPTHDEWQQAVFHAGNAADAALLEEHYDV